MRNPLFLLLLASSVYTQQCPCPPIDTCAPTQRAYLPAARRCLDADSSFDTYFSLDFLYWSGTERGLEYALKNTGSFFTQTLQIYEPDFDFTPAFRLGLGTHLPYDNWDLEASYTWFYNQSSNRTHGGSIHSVWTSSIAFLGNNFRALWQEADAKWKLHSHFVDLFLKHRLYLSRKITIEPSFGLKLALLQQRFTVGYGTGNTVIVPAGFTLAFGSSHIAMKNRSFNLGPTVGLMSRWNAFRHIDFLGAIGASLLASHFDVGRNESNTGTNTTTSATLRDSIRQGDEFWACRPQAALSFGLGWDDCVCARQRTIHYGLSAAYEAQIWWKQNMLFRYIDQTHAAMISPTQGNLYFYGLNIQAFVDF